MMFFDCVLMESFLLIMILYACKIMIRRNDSRLDPQFCLASGSFEFSEFSQLIKVSSSDRLSSKLGISNQSFYVVFARPVQVYPSDLELYSGRGGCRVEHKVFPV